MANIFANGDELLNKKDFDQKVNIDGSIYEIISNNQSIQDVIGAIPHTGMHILKVFRDNSDPGKTAGHNGSGIAFGGEDTVAIISVDGWHAHQAQVTWSNSDQNGAWHENIAWQSDIDALKARVDALEKQIGGVLSSLLNHLFSRKWVVA